MSLIYERVSPSTQILVIWTALSRRIWLYRSYKQEFEIVALLSASVLCLMNQSATWEEALMQDCTFLSTIYLKHLSALGNSSSYYIQFYYPLIIILALIDNHTSYSVLSSIFTLTFIIQIQPNNQNLNFTHNNYFQPITTTHFNMTPINLDLDKYIRNFRIFYSKIVNGHPEQANLQKKFKFLVENETTKWRAGLFTNNIEDNAISLKTFLSKTKSAVTKPNTKKQKRDWLFETQNFSRCFVFRSILTLIELKSKQGIQMIRAHLENDGALSEGKMFSGFAFRKVAYAWSKIQKLFVNNFASKPHSALSECINEFPQEFTDVLYDVFVDRRVPKLGLNEINQEKLETLSDLIKTTINFFEFENEKPRNVKKGGNYKKNIFIGYLAEEQVYVVSKQLPKNHAQDQNELKTLSKLSQMSSDLFKMYENDEIKLRNLDSIVTIKPKESQLPGMQSSLHKSPIPGPSRTIMSTANTPPRSGNSRGMMSSTLHGQLKSTSSSGRLMANSSYGGLGKKNSLSGSGVSFRGNSIMSSSKY